MNSVIPFYCIEGEFYELNMIVQIRLNANGRKRPFHTLLLFPIMVKDSLDRVIRTAISQELSLQLATSVILIRASVNIQVPMVGKRQFAWGKPFKECI